MIITRNAIRTGRISWGVRCAALFVGRSSADYTRRRASDAYETPRRVQALEQSMLALEKAAPGHHQDQLSPSICITNNAYHEV